MTDLSVVPEANTESSEVVAPSPAPTQEQYDSLLAQAKKLDGLLALTRQQLSEVLAENASLAYDLNALKAPTA